MKIKDFISYFLFPPKCAACDKTIGDRFLLSPLCEECEERFLEEREKKCSLCQNKICECICSPQALKESGCLFHVKVAFYSSTERDSICDRAVYRMKNSNDTSLFDYAAKIISPSLVKETEKALINTGAKFAFLTYPPRSKKSVREYGHDQAKALAKAISKRTGIRIINTAKRAKRKNFVMKSLSYEERFYAAGSAFLPTDKCQSLKEGLAIIIDDVITSGATTLALSKILKEKGVKAFAVASFGAVEK